MKKLTLLIGMFILLSTFTLAITYDEIDSVINEESFNTVDIDSYHIYPNGLVDLNLSRGETLVFLRGVRGVKNISNIYFNPNTDYDTSAVTINNIELDNATIYLKKNKEKTVNKILHSKNGINFTVDYSINASQNKTHVWFNVDHFSSWTSAMDDIFIYWDILDSSSFIEPAVIYVEDDYANVDADDCIIYTGRDEDSGIDLSTIGCGSGGFDSGAVEYYSDAYGIPIYEVDVIGEAVYLTVDSTWASSIQERFDDDYTTFDRISITDSTRTTEEANSGIVDLTVKGFNSPDATTLSATTISQTSAFLNCNIDRDDLESLQYYSDFYNPSAGVEYVEFHYKKTTDSTWSTSTFYDDPSDGENVAIQITGLTQNTQYQYYCDYEWVDIRPATDTTDNALGSTLTFTTLGTPTPTVTTLNAIEGDTKAKLRAVASFNGYTGGDVSLAFHYNVTGATSYIRVPSSGWFVPSDNVIYTTDYITGLTNGQVYDYYAEIVYDSGSLGDNGSINEFTPSQESVNDFLTGNQWWISSNDSVITDSSGNLTIGIFGVVASGNDMLFVSSQSDYLNLGNNLAETDNIGTVITRLDLSSLNNDQDFFSIGNGATANTVLVGRISSSNKLVYLFRDDDGLNLNICTGTTILNTTTTYNLAISSDDNNFQFNINGIDESFSCSVSDNGIWFDSLGSGTHIYTHGAFIGSTSINFLDATVQYMAYYDIELTTQQLLALYNQGDYFNPYTPQISLIIPEVLPATNIDYESATLNGVVSFNSSIYTVSGGFNYRINGSSTWSNVSITSINDSITFSSNITGLSDESVYEYQSFIFYSEEGDPLVSFSDSGYFTTTEIPPPSLTTLSAQNVTNQSVALRGTLNDLYGWNDTNLYFLYKKVADEDYTVLAYSTFTSTGSFVTQLTNLTSETPYMYRLQADYRTDKSNSTYGDIVYFTTSETGAPIVNTLPAENIYRDNAELVGELVDLGLYSSVNISFRYGNSSNNYTTSKIPYSIDGVEFNIPITGLRANTTYNYEVIASYGNKNISGGIVNFTTLSFLDYIPPELTSIDVLDEFLTFTSAQLFCIINMRDATQFYVRFKVVDGDTLIPVNTSSYVLYNTSQTISYIAKNLDSNTDYSYRCDGYTDFTNISTFTSSEYYDFTTLDVVESPKYVEIFPDVEIYIENPYLFVTLFIVVMTVVMCILMIFFRNEDAGISKVMLYVLTGLEFGFIVFAYLKELLPPFEFFNIILGSGLLVVYFARMNSTGAVYG